MVDKKGIAARMDEALLLDIYAFRRHVNFMFSARFNGIYYQPGVVWAGNK